MFHRAEPDDAGLGVTILTPGLVRSDILMPSGLPFWTTITTAESETIPLVGPDFQSSATKPALTSRVTSPSSEKFT